MVSIAVSKMVWPSWFLSTLEWKSTASTSITTMIYFLLADAASDQVRCRRYVSLSATKRCISSCQGTETSDFVGPDLWPPNSPDLNLVDYKVWGVMQQKVCECRMNSVDELKPRLVEVWNSLQQNIIDAVINERRKQLRVCVHANKQHFEHLLWVHVTDKRNGQIKYK